MRHLSKILETNFGLKILYGNIWQYQIIYRHIKMHQKWYTDIWGYIRKFFYRPAIWRVWYMQTNNPRLFMASYSYSDLIVRIFIHGGSRIGVYILMCVYARELGDNCGEYSGIILCRVWRQVFAHTISYEPLPDYDDDGTRNDDFASSGCTCESTVVYVSDNNSVWVRG